MAGTPNDPLELSSLDNSENMLSNTPRVGPVISRRAAMRCTATAGLVSILSVLIAACSTGSYDDGQGTPTPDSGSDGGDSGSSRPGSNSSGSGSNSSDDDDEGDDDEGDDDDSGGGGGDDDDDYKVKGSPGINE